MSDPLSQRIDYMRDKLDEADAPADPVAFLRAWLLQAADAREPEPNAATLATADASGRPNARVVLVRGIDEHGIVFYTNTQSRKGRELAGNPRCSLLFSWLHLHRQVRIDGTATFVDDAEADAYFAARPRGAQLGAWASAQSEPIPDRAHLEARLADYEQRFDGKDVPRPPHWSGYRVVPDALEFWQGRANRLHDRLLYARGEDGWTVQRLAP